MPIPLYCPHPECPNFHSPPRRWLVRYGHYHTAAHGLVQRYRCRSCRRSLSDQTQSMHYFSKLRLPLKAIWLSFLGGACLREIARRYHLSCPTLQSAILRLGRQAMAAHLAMLHRLNPRTALVYDGLRSFVSSQDYPCEITTVLDPQGETILTMTHTVMRRGGTTTEAQLMRLQQKLSVWAPLKGTMKKDISLLISELWEYLRPCAAAPALITTDEQPLYRSLLAGSAVCAHFRVAGLLTHRRIKGSAPRTRENPLFPANYVDRLLRHRVKEHTRESIGFGRNATMQMHRAWIFACDHNLMREYRVRKPLLGTHAGRGTIDPEQVPEVQRQFFTRRIRVLSREIPESVRRVWSAKVITPPVRWKVGQRGTSIRVPAYALADLDSWYQQAS